MLTKQHTEPNKTTHKNITPRFGNALQKLTLTKSDGILVVPSDFYIILHSLIIVIVNYRDIYETDLCK